MNEKDIKLMEDFLSGTLGESEQAMVENRIASEPAFAEELNLRKKMDRYLDYQNSPGIKIEDITQIQKAYFAPKEEDKKKWTWEKNKRLYIGLAASIAILIVLSILLNNWIRPDRNLEELLTAYSAHTPINLVSRGNTTCPNNSAIETSFNAGKYSEALPLIESCIVNQTDDQILLLAKGICLMEMDQTEEATEIFGALANGESLLKTEGLWYASINAIKKESFLEATQLLEQIPVGSNRYEAARQLLGAIGRE